MILDLLLSQLSNDKKIRWTSWVVNFVDRQGKKRRHSLSYGEHF